MKILSKTVTMVLIVTYAVCIWLSVLMVYVTVSNVVDYSSPGTNQELVRPQSVFGKLAADVVTSRQSSLLAGW